MNHQQFLVATSELTQKVCNKHPISTPCVIFKEDQQNQVRLIDYTIDKDVLSQIIFDVLRSLRKEECGLPIIVATENNVINRMESAGVYYVNIRKNEFVYLFGKEDYKRFFESLTVVQERLNLKGSLLISFLTDSPNQCSVNEKLSDQLNELIHLHGDLNCESTSIEHPEVITFPLLNTNFNLRLLHWIKKKGGVEHVK
ncbi:hypothetical protein [Shouchella lehensis]|uniref:hypothetical protein n=1 Tax=Shouchella lehensis TaxID=300825 RepID=UPI00141929A5|nr:hypothetical protein [Shouchella lehensis]MBG9783352.1 hypothetical protein [Shouchella lehensis]